MRKAVRRGRRESRTPFYLDRMHIYILRFLHVAVLTQWFRQRLCCNLCLLHRVSGARGPASRPGRGARGAGRQSCFCIAVSPYTDIFAGVVSFCYPAPRSTHLCISKSLYLYISVSPYLRWRCKSRLPVSSPYARDSSLIKQQTDTCGRWLIIWVTAAV